MHITRFPRKDEYSIGSTNTARASYKSDNSWLTLYIDNIWKDTQNFEDFVEGLNVIYLTELLCMNSKEDQYAYPLCKGNGKTKNNCLFLKGAKKALHSNYLLFKNDHDNKILNR